MPENMLDNIAEGKLQKHYYYKESTLLIQELIKYNEQTTRPYMLRCYGYRLQVRIAVNLTKYIPYRM